MIATFRRIEYSGIAYFGDLEDNLFYRFSRGKEGSMSIQAIKKLKQLTLNKEAHFADCFNYFLDLTKDPQFMAEGKQLPNVPGFFNALLQPVAKFFDADIDKERDQNNFPNF